MTTLSFIAERKFIILLTLFLFINTLSQNAFSQNQVGDSKIRKVKLINWNAANCDNTYDPSRLINRVTDIQVRNVHTLITVNFSDNCCATFKPTVQFRDSKLFLSPYDDKELREVCFCDCCFSIQFEIDGLLGREYSIYFRGNKIERSDDHYKVSEPTQEVYQGSVINRRNKYGFNEGMWISFYENGVQKEVIKYPEIDLYGKNEPIWARNFYPSGRLTYYSRNDTTETWFEDGQIKSQFLYYRKGDTTYQYEFRRHENRQLEKNYLSKSYPTIFTSEFDTSYHGKGSARKTVHREDFYENGKTKFLYSKDTSYSWYKSGKIESKTYNNGSLKYDEQGFMIERDFHWKQRGPSNWGDLKHSMYVNFNRNGKASKIHYVRDETVKDGISNGHYYWVWDDKMILIESPKNWKEHFPWSRFNEIQYLIKSD